MTNDILSQSAIEVKPLRPEDFHLDIRLKVGEDRNADVVTLLRTGEQYMFIHWLQRMESAAAELERFLAIRRIDPAIFSAHQWMRKNGIKTKEAFLYFVAEVLPKLRLPADSPLATMRCRRCGSEVWGRESLLTGIGSSCRRNGHRRTGAVQVVAEAAT